MLSGTAAARPHCCLKMTVTFAMGTTMRILLFAPMTRFSMEPYVGLLARALADRADLQVRLITLDGLGDCSTSLAHSRLFIATNRMGKLLRIGSPAAYLTLRREVREFDPDIVHILNGEGMPWTAFLAQQARRCGAGVVVTVHDPEPHPGHWVDRANYLFSRPVLSAADVLHVHKRHQTAELEKRGHTATRKVVIPHGNFADLYRLPKQDAPAREPAAVFFGRFEPYKGIGTLLEAWTKVPEPYRLLLVGPGELSVTERGLLENLGGRVELHNRFVSDNEVGHLLSRAHVMVLPYTQVTQSALPAIGAGLGLVVVASDLDGFRDEITASGGILVDPNSAPALAEGIKRAFSMEAKPASAPSFHEVSEELVRVYKSIKNKLQSLVK